MQENTVFFSINLLVISFSFNECLGISVEKKKSKAIEKEFRDFLCSSFICKFFHIVLDFFMKIVQAMRVQNLNDIISKNNVSARLDFIQSSSNSRGFKNKKNDFSF